MKAKGKRWRVSPVRSTPQHCPERGASFPYIKRDLDEARQAITERTFPDIIVAVEFRENPAANFL